MKLQAQTSGSSIEPYPGLVKADSRLILKSGYLVVPENRKKPKGAKIKIPFFFVRRPDQDARKNITLYTTGGPGYSTTANIDSIGYNSGFLRYGGFIAFDQRGTKRAKPCLSCPEVDSAVRRSYLEGKSKDSLVFSAVKRCRQKFERQGVDLSAYNTLESAEDINDLRLTLNLDSLNLVGISYSGGLMLTVAKLHPEGVRTLVLNSPLPSFVNYEEHGLLNINEALDQVFDNCEADSSGTAYAGLRNRFKKYFTDISGKYFSLKYKEASKNDSVDITYSKDELLDAVVNRLNTAQVKNVPHVVKQILEGHHAVYVREVLDGYFNGDRNVSLGMRYSVYCSEQIQYSSPKLQKEQDRLLPWLAGYHLNNVDHQICGCWQVAAEPKSVKDPVYSLVPALISAGDIDPWCRPYYNRLIQRHLPNSQVLILKNKGHGPGYYSDGVDYLDMFMRNPFKKLSSNSKGVKVE
jgi:pimeloyl-ACP methyl ester carboxylesterase